MLFFVRSSCLSYLTQLCFYLESVGGQWVGGTNLLSLCCEFLTPIKHILKSGGVRNDESVKPSQSLLGISEKGDML